MAGFLKGLINGNGDSTPKAPKAKAPKDASKQEAFFLSADDAKSFGDIEYMRSTKTVKRTFAKKKGQKEHLESVKAISAVGAVEVQEGQTPSIAQPVWSPIQEAAATQASAPAPTPTPAAAAPAPQAKPAAAPAPAPQAKPATFSQPYVAPLEQRQATAKDLDMFRNMARSMGRKA